MRGLDLIGAGENLAAFTILLHVKSIDTAKLQAAAGSGVIPGAIAVVNEMPQLAIEMVLPVVKSKLATSGIMADLSVTPKAPKAGNPHEMILVLGVGAVLGAVLAVAGRALYHLVVPAVPVNR